AHGPPRLAPGALSRKPRHAGSRARNHELPAVRLPGLRAGLDHAGQIPGDRADVAPARGSRLGRDPARPQPDRLRPRPAPLQRLWRMRFTAKLSSRDSKESHAKAQRRKRRKDWSVATWRLVAFYFHASPFRHRLRQWPTRPQLPPLLAPAGRSSPRV